MPSATLFGVGPPSIQALGPPGFGNVESNGRIARSARSEESSKTLCCVTTFQVRSTLFGPSLPHLQATGFLQGSRGSKLREIMQPPCDRRDHEGSPVADHCFN